MHSKQTARNFEMLRINRADEASGVTARSGCDPATGLFFEIGLADADGSLANA